MRALGLALLLVLCGAGRAEAAITVTNECYQEANNTAAFVECTGSFTAGEIIVVICQSDGAASTRTITDGTHDTAYNDNLLDSGGGVLPGYWMSWATAAGSASYTPRCTNSANYYGAVRVISLANATWSANGSIANGSGDAAVSATLGASGIVLGAMARAGAGAITEDGTLIGEQETYTNTTGSAQYKTGSGSITLNWVSAAGNWRGGAMAFTDNGGGGGAAPVDHSGLLLRGMGE